MMVTFVSQCEKKALYRTRRVLDAFADRIGDNTWQTVITQEGLLAVKKLLRKTASKNTAVSCHWIRSRSRSELVWIVGNRLKFNAQGIVPVNSTENDIEHFMDKSVLNTLPVIMYAATIAALFHDFGKATVLFQKKLNPKEKTEKFEPYCHEWISFRIFQAFANGKLDEQWLAELSEIEKTSFPECFKDGLDRSQEPKLSDLAPFARLVAWLIVTHHKLPVYPGWKENENNPPSLNYIDHWLEQNFTPLWNSYRCNDNDQKERVAENWQFSDLPVQSSQWRSKACTVASEALAKLRPRFTTEIDWLHEQLFTTHLSRLCLMLADHYYSSLTLEEAKERGSGQWCNRNYPVYANTALIDGEKRYKQQLDEHLTGVAHHATGIVKGLAKLNSSLNPLEPNDELTSNVPKKPSKDFKNFGWQNEARKMAEKIGKDTLQHGFFGLNMASTGKGKTRANAKIMAALGKQVGRVRFSVALGLRVLTLQTGKEYRKELGLSDSELAISVGGTAFKQLFEYQQSQSNREKAEHEAFSAEQSGSESREEFLDPDSYLHYNGKIQDHSLRRWTKVEKGLDELLAAPVLVSTIDHLMPATEGTKGGRQIPATLRLLTSDLVLDEPDDFGLSDLPALCRLVNWAGMLGSRVLLSTATIPPALACALFESYRFGWEQYAKVNLEGWSGEITCAWFDEQDRKSKRCRQIDSFKKEHRDFVKKRIKYLRTLPPKRKADIIKITRNDCETIAESMATTIQERAVKLHLNHCISRHGKTLSIGLVRMANINPLVAVSKALMKKEAPKNTSIHYCIYHSRYPLAIRASIESKLDRLLNRKDPEKIWEEPEVKEVLQSTLDAKHYIFIILASPVAEVGRDHDYDWAIVEPSSMRSIIQLAGRILRHRDIVPEMPNLLLLHKNYKALKTSNKEKICFTRPGFESKDLKLENHDLCEIMDEEQYQEITAMQRITLPDDYRISPEGRYENFVELEHKALANQLFSGNSPAKVWWNNQPHWCGEVQRQQRFRDSNRDEAYYLCLDNDYTDPEWQWKNEHVSPPEFGAPLVKITKEELGELGAGSSFWFHQDALTVYQQLSEDLDLDLVSVSRRFGEVRLIEYENASAEEYNYHPQLGLYQDVRS